MISLILMILALYSIYKYAGWPGVIGFFAFAVLLGIIAAIAKTNLDSSSRKASLVEKAGGYSVDELETFDLMDEDGF